VRGRIDAVTLMEMYGERQAFDQTLGVRHTFPSR
jgi:hypothetical protein